jgi:polyhydroxybutyrate depolymerase
VVQAELGELDESRAVLNRGRASPTLAAQPGIGAGERVGYGARVTSLVSARFRFSRFMHRLPWHAGSLAIVLAVACSKPTTNASSEPPRTEASASEASSPVRGAGQPFGERAHLFVPPSRAKGERLPFVLALHGLGGSGEELVQGIGLSEFAAREGFIYAAPDGTRDAQGRLFWDAGSVCCNFQRTSLNDVERLTSLIDYAVTSLEADPGRIFIVGYSNGGFMAHRIACERSRAVNAIVSIAASGPAPTDSCAAETPVNVLELHGDHDRIVPIDGGHLFGANELPITPGVRPGLEVWSRRAECEGPLAEAERRDLIDDLPQSETVVSRFARCKRAALELWVVQGGAHAINLRQRMLGAIWQFLRALPPKARSVK